MIPLSVPNICGNEWKYIKECLDTNWVSSVGTYVTMFEKHVADFCGANHAVATSSGTTALHINLILAGVERTDLVILPNITFVAPANAIKYAGADPILIDIDEATWQIDVGLLENFLRKNTFLENGRCIHKGTGRRVTAVLPVHVLGNICEMDHLLQLAVDYHLVVVEDSTEALGSYYKSKHAGTLGRLGTLSFNGNKIITTGGGGMILTNDEQLATKAKHLTTQAKSMAGEYYHDEVGYNYRLVNILAAMGVAQMEGLPSFLKRKKEIAHKYDTLFDNIRGAVNQKITTDVTANHWLYTVRLPNQPNVRQYLREKEVEARPLWVPMNQLPAFKDDIYINAGDVSDKIYKSCLSLPCSTGLSDEDQGQVINLLQQFYHD